MKNNQVHVGPGSEVRLTAAEGVTLASLQRGTLRVRNGDGETLLVEARGLLIAPEGTARYHVGLAKKGIVVSTEQGVVRVQGTSGSYTVPAGKAMQFDVAAAPQGPVGVGGNSIGPVATAAIAIGVSLGWDLPVAWAVANDEAEKACEEAIRAVSPPAPTTSCD